MTTITLDFSSSYRGITENDLRPILVRDPFGWNGKGEPEAAVVLTYTNGTVVNIPAREGTQGLPKFFVDHSPHSNQFDLINLFEKEVLRFDIPVNGMPIWENYVKAAYTGDAAVDQSSVDISAYGTALDDWFNYVMTNEFRASACAYSDQGANWGSSRPRTPC